MTILYGPDGRPLSPISRPRRPMDVAAVARIEQPAQRWAVGIGRINPERVARVLREAAFGYNEQYITLAVEMEEKYLHYASQLATRKQSIIGEEIEVLPGDDSPEAAKIAEDFEKYVVDSEQFPDLLLDLLDALAKGYAVVQPHWDTSTRPWTFKEFESVDQRLFCYDHATLTELRIRDLATVDGQRIPAGQFIVHTPRVRTGVPCRGGLARPAAIGWMFQSATVAQWATFAEVFGMPLRIGRYDPVTASEQEIDDLRTAVVNIGHDAAAILPDSMRIEFADARRPTSGDNVFQGLADYWDKQISKLIVGQTMTADDGSSQSQAQVHDKVRLDIKQADARALQSTLFRQLVAPWTAFNYGPNAAVPKLRICVEPGEDLAALSAALAPLLKAGLRVSAHELREKFGLTDPEGDEEIVGGSPPAPVAPPPPPAQVP
jgi:phage gp29-like protein